MIPFNELDQALLRHMQRQANGAVQQPAVATRNSAPNAGRPVIDREAPQAPRFKDQSIEFPIDEVVED